jgi:hypothetical protein
MVRKGRNDGGGGKRKDEKLQQVRAEQGGESRGWTGNALNV